MKISGIVCEYNPFHNGHLYHIEKTRENGATHIVSVMSGNFVQRGEPAIADKFSRARAAVKGGADLVIEIPAPYVLSSAEYYARGAVFLLDALGCINEISFGSECGDISLLKESAEAADRYSDCFETRKLVKSGLSFPDALNRVIRENCGETVADVLMNPNNILASEYIKALSSLNSTINPYTVCRKNAGHDTNAVCDEFASASCIRTMINDGQDISGVVPYYTNDLVNGLSGNIASVSALERVILYKLRTASLDEIKNLPDVGQGLEYRIKESASGNSIDEVFFKIKTKRYTMARIKRIIMCMLIGIKKGDMDNLPPYGRILAMNKRGAEILAQAKSKKRIPVDTSLAKLRDTDDVCRRFAEIESNASEVYALACRDIGLAGTEFTAKIGIT